MSKDFSKSIAIGLTMVLVGLSIGFSVINSYAQPIPKKDNGGAGYLTFQSVCTTCHDETRPKNYTGTASWGEVINQMKGFGAFVTDDQAKEIEGYLQETYPRK